MGHLRASCPKLQTPYPCDRDNYVWHADSVCQGNRAVCGNSGVSVVTLVGKGHAKTHLGPTQGASLQVLGPGDVCKPRDLETGIIAKGQDTVSVNNSSEGILQEAIGGKNLSNNGYNSVNSTLDSNCNTSQAISLLGHKENEMSDDLPSSLELTRCWEI